MKEQEEEGTFSLSLHLSSTHHLISGALRRRAEEEDDEEEESDAGRKRRGKRPARRVMHCFAAERDGDVKKGKIGAPSFSKKKKKIAKLPLSTMKAEGKKVFRTRLPPERVGALLCIDREFDGGSMAT